MSGTNAHVILEQAPDTPDAVKVPAPPELVWLLSAKSPEALHDQARQLLEIMLTRPTRSNSPPRSPKPAPTTNTAPPSPATITAR
jgi:acyl transferase domain-containing protein